jgi:hypothetical protein
MILIRKLALLVALTIQQIIACVGVPPPELFRDGISGNIPLL